MNITGPQCRAGRALVNMTQDVLASLSRVSKRTIANFEQSERQAVPATVEAIRRALESAGVEFIPENGGGVGVRLKKS
jgi:transcriptional regulator with XRE-family HTH domain